MEFTKYSDEANRTYQNISHACISDVRATFDKLPNLNTGDDFDIAMKKIKAVPVSDRIFGKDSKLDKETIFKLARELDRMVTLRQEAGLDRHAAERLANYDLQDAVARRKNEFEQAKLNTAALVAAGFIEGGKDE